MQNIILMFIHLGAASIAFGAIVFVIIIVRPVLKRSQEKIPIEESVELKLLDLLAATVLACVFVLIITGVYYLLVNYTDQVNLKEGYYNIFGMKMLFVLATLGLSIYQAFGLRAKISDLDLRPENIQKVPSTLNSMVNNCYITIWTLVIAIFFGVFLGRY